MGVHLVAVYVASRGRTPFSCRSAGPKATRWARLRQETPADVLREVARLPERERGIVLGVARQLGDR